MLRIGVTGGIGTGKSTVCKVFETLGIPVFYADTEARNLLTENASIQSGLKKIFGDVIFDEGIPDRKKIAAIVFHEKEKLAQLNALIHPATIARSNEWFLEQKEVPYAIKEAALIFEAGVDTQLDFIIVVTAPEELCISRIMQREKISADDVKARMKNQMPQAEKTARADFVIQNDDVIPVIPQVVKLHEALLHRTGRL